MTKCKVYANAVFDVCVYYFSRQKKCKCARKERVQQKHLYEVKNEYKIKE